VIGFAHLRPLVATLIFLFCMAVHINIILYNAMSLVEQGDGVMEDAQDRTHSAHLAL